MKVKALISFGGKISMSVGQVKDIKDEAVYKDLLCAGYIEPYAQEAEIVEKPVEKPKTTPKKVVENSTKKTTKKRKK